MTKAVRASDLPAPSRLVMLVLADVAEVGTAEIPARFSPSLRVLAGETGLNRSTVKRHLAALEGSGWIVRTRPDAAAMWAGERNRYRLDLPEEVGAQEAHLGAEDTQGGRTENPGVGAQDTTGGRTESPLETDPSDQRQISVRSKKAAKKQPDAETTEQRVNRLSKIYTDRVKLSNFVAVRGVVKKAVNADVTDDKIAHGLNRLADENRAVTTDSLRYAIYGVPPSQFRQNGSSHKPFSDDREKDYEASW